MRPFPSSSRVRCGALLLVLLAAPAAAEGPVFVDATDEAGVRYLQHDASPLGECILGSFCEPERMSGGVAVGDVDGDGLPDLFFTRLDDHDLLFRNLGDGTFEEISAASGLSAYDVQSNGAAFADIDNDGDLDLMVVVIAAPSDPVNGRNFLFVNDGNGFFTEEAVPRGAAVADARQRHMYSVNAGDYDLDGWVDLHVSEWAPFLGSHSRLLRNRGAAAPGHFEDVTDAAGVNLEGVHAFSSTFTDLDLDGLPDLAVAADFLTSRLFWNNGDGTFTERTFDSGVGSDENGMGSTFGDITGDGLFEWFVTSIFDAATTCDFRPCNWGYTGNRLYRNEGGRQFTDATDEIGVRNGYWGWGAAFLEADNDRDLDLVMTNGVRFPGFTVDDAFNDDPMRFWLNDGTGRMTERSAQAALTDTGSGKGLAVVDYDADGDLDIVLVNNADTARLFRNETANGNGWLRVRTRGRTVNREGLGARIELHEVLGGPVQVREMGTSTHFLGQSERVAHFGTGSGERPLDLLRVVWPGGKVQSMIGVSRNTALTVEEQECRDADGDGFCEAVDCDDSDGANHPLPESCDLADNDCDGEVDEGLPRCRDLRSHGFYRRLCRGDHPDGAITAADVACVAGSSTFAGISSAAEICDVLAGRHRGDACARAEIHLMALQLNVCQGRAGEDLPVAPTCGDGATAGEALASSDLLLAAPGRTRAACEEAQCIAEEINTGDALP